MSESALATRIESKIDKSVSANTGLTATGSMNFSSVEQIMEFAKVMAIASVAVPKHLRENVGACLAVAIQASEWQMSPFAVASKTYVVNDRLAFEAQLVNAVILKRAPIIGRFKISYQGEGQSRRCTVSATLSDGEVVDYQSPTFQTIPVKNSPLWKSDPDQQLFYYSSRAMCRRHFPDVLLGIYTPDELQDGAIDGQIEMIPAARVGAQRTPLEDAKPKLTPKAEPKPEPAPIDVEPEPPAAADPAPPTDAQQETATAQQLLAEITPLRSGAGLSKPDLNGILVKLGILQKGESFDTASAEVLQQIKDRWQEVEQNA